MPARKKSTAKVTVVKKKKISKKTVAKVAGVVSAVGLGAVLFQQRDKVKNFVQKLFNKNKAS